MAGRPNVPRPYKSKEWLMLFYIEKQLSAKECAELAGCHENTVFRWLKRHGIETRYQAAGELSPMWGRKGKLHHNFNSVEKVCPACGKTFWVPKQDAKRRKTCSWACRNKWWKMTGKQRGENSPSWLGGIDYRRGKGWKKAREIARKRDRYKCVVCGKTEEELGQELDVHHVIPYRCFDNDGEGNHPDNLISMCKSCHAEADRAYRRLEKQGEIQAMAGLPSTIRSIRRLDKTLPRLVA